VVLKIDIDTRIPMYVLLIDKFKGDYTLSQHYL